MLKLLPLKRKKPLWFLIAGLIFIAVCAFLYRAGLIINITGSMPRGIYWRGTGKIHRGDLVAFCLDKKNQLFGLERGYLIHGTRCQFSEPLIKKVIAVPSDNIFLSSQSIRVNAHTYPYQTFTTDAKGRPLVAYPSGNYTDTKDYWVMGTDSQKSWDSRYFGPIHSTAILWKIKPLLVYLNHKATNEPEMKQCTLTFDNNITLNAVPLAETLEQQKRGLSGKENMAQGMLFTFAHPQRVGFWMKDTSTPLSIGFFDANGTLISIEEMKPNTKKLYFSAGDAKDALELPQGQFQELGIHSGVKLLHQYCK
jgi:conjugative transfer signal peptidase TraF